MMNVDLGPGSLAMELRIDDSPSACVERWGIGHGGGLVEVAAVEPKNPAALREVAREGAESFARSHII